MSTLARRILSRPSHLNTTAPPRTAYLFRPFSSTSTTMARAYWFDNSPADQRAPHDSGREVNEATLKTLGIHLFHYPNLADVDALAKERSYKNRDEVTISPEAMGEVYETKVKGFFQEHLHEDEEIRYIRDGAGYFDVRSKEDEWVRIRLEKDDLMIMPPGSYHRFTTDEKNYIKAMRLFKEDPKWTPLNRGEETETNSFRKAYVQMREKLMGDSASA